MSNNGNNDPPEKDRVEDDTDAEVVRLDAPKWAPIERKESTNEDRAMLDMLGDAREVEAAKAEASNPENEWLEEAENKELNAIPFGWFVLLVISIAGLIFWAVGYNTRSSESGGVGKSALDGSDVPLGKLEELNEIEKARAHYDAMEEVVTRFLAAETVEERAKYVRDVDRVLPLMKGYYQRKPLESFEFQKTLEYHVVSLEHFPFIALRVEVAGNATKPLLIEDIRGGLKVDWESFVCFQPIDISRFAEERSVEPTSLRAYVEKDQFYAYEFADESKFSCFKLTFRESDVEIFGYVERGTELEEEFRKLFPEGAPAGLKRPLILSVSYLSESRAPRSVKINQLLSKLWAYPPGAFESVEESPIGENESSPK